MILSVVNRKEGRVHRAQQALPSLWVDPSCNYGLNELS